MSQAILYTPQPGFFNPGQILIDSPFFDSSNNLIFQNYQGKVCIDIPGGVTGFEPRYDKTLQECMQILWKPRAWTISFDAYSATFEGIPRTIGGGGYYYRITGDSDDVPDDLGLRTLWASSAGGEIYSLLLPRLPNADADPITSLYDIGWWFQLITPDGLGMGGSLSTYSRSTFGILDVCGSMQVTCGDISFTETLYAENGIGVSSATLTALF